MKRHSNYLSPYNLGFILDLQAARERRERESNPPKYGPGIREAEEGYQRSRGERAEPEPERVAPSRRPQTESEVRSALVAFTQEVSGLLLGFVEWAASRV